MLDQHDRQPEVPAYLADGLGHLLRLPVGHAGDRLVEQQQRGPRGQGPAHLDPLAVAVGQRVHRGAQQVRDPQHLGDPADGLAVLALLAPGTGEPEHAGHQAAAHQPVPADQQVVLDGVLEGQRDVLEGPGHAQPGDPVRPQRGQLGVPVVHGALGGPVGAAQHVDQRGLAGAVGPDQRVHGAGLDGEGDLAERGDAAEPHGQALHPQPLRRLRGGDRRLALDHLGGHHRDGDAQVPLLDVVAGGQLVRRPRRGDPADLQHRRGVRDPQAHDRVLLDQQDGGALPVDLGDDLADLVDQQRGQAQARLVEQQQLRRGHERPAHGEHLLLTTRQQAAGLVAALGQDREQVEHPVAGLGAGCLVPHGVPAGPEVLGHGQVAEDPPSLGHLDQPAPDDVRGVGPGEVLPGEGDRAAGDRAAVGLQRPGDRAQQRGLAGPVGPQDGDDLPGRDGQRDVGQRGDRPVVDDVEVLDGQQRCGHRCPSRIDWGVPGHEKARDNLYVRQEVVYLSSHPVQLCWDLRDRGGTWTGPGRGRRTARRRCC
ncbi:unannotated protein [freshwater metagenome]|uniref:Unannotated protein n=1 Tax=freshwater metagenome TaxID=449393 RepID=A0A6J7I0P3_9ZZZZ